MEVKSILFLCIASLLILPSYEDSKPNKEHIRLRRKLKLKIATKQKEIFNQNQQASSFPVSKSNLCETTNEFMYKMYDECVKPSMQESFSTFQVFQSEVIMTKDISKIENLLSSFNDAKNRSDVILKKCADIFTSVRCMQRSSPDDNKRREEFFFNSTALFSHTLFKNIQNIERIIRNSIKKNSKIRWTQITNAAKSILGALEKVMKDCFVEKINKDQYVKLGKEFKKETTNLKQLYKPHKVISHRTTLEKKLEIEKKKAV